MSSNSRLDVFYKKLLLKSLQNSQENTCARVSFLVGAALACNFIKKGLWRRCFLAKFVKLKEHLSMGAFLSIFNLLQIRKFRTELNFIENYFGIQYKIDIQYSASIDVNVIEMLINIGHCVVLYNTI